MAEKITLLAKPDVSLGLLYECLARELSASRVRFADVAHADAKDGRSITVAESEPLNHMWIYEQDCSDDGDRELRELTEAEFRETPGYPAEEEPFRFFNIDFHELDCAGEVIAVLADDPRIWIEAGGGVVMHGPEFVSRLRADPGWDWWSYGLEH